MVWVKDQSIDPPHPSGGGDHCQGLRQRRQGQVTDEGGTLNPFHQSERPRQASKSVIDNVLLTVETENNVTGS